MGNTDFNRDEKKNQHPAELMGVDPFDFSALGGSTAGRQHHTQSLVERVFGFMERYERQIA